MRDWMIPALLVVILVVFGSKRLPDMAQSIGQSLRILRRESSSPGEPDDAAAPRAANAAPPAVTPAVSPAVSPAALPAAMTVPPVSQPVPPQPAVVDGRERPER
jgi:sec-independent protein translocase protein TatA